MCLGVMTEIWQRLQIFVDIGRAQVKSAWSTWLASCTVLQFKSNKLLQGWHFWKHPVKKMKITARDKKEGFKKSGSNSLIHGVWKILLPFLNQSFFVIIQSKLTLNLHNHGSGFTWEDFLIRFFQWLLYWYKILRVI